MKFPTQFITATHEFCSYDKHINAPLMRRLFTLQKGIKTAAILVTGLGFYELYVNGVLLSKPLAPYISAPNDIVYYNQYDVAPHLREGENVIGLILGNGMQNAFGGSIWDFHIAPWRGAPKAALSLDVSYENGGTFGIATDENFLTSPSPITFDDLRCGEYYDARLEQDGWSKPGFDASGWKPAMLAIPPGGEKRLCIAEPIVVTGELKPVSVTKRADGYCYDFGVNEAGVCKLTISGTPGQEITVTHWEHMIDDELIRYSRFQPDEYNQTDKYICSGRGTETFMPRFTYHGFRYAVVSGITEAQATPGLLTYQIMHSNLEERGGFTCSDPVANKLQELTRRSTLSNFHYFPTDCPHREKNGWTGDAAISVEHTLLNLAPETSYLEWLRSVCKAQNAAGTFPGIVPTGGWGFEWGNGPAWDRVIAVLPYFTYRYRGDKTILHENGTGIFRYLHYINRNLRGDGLVELGLGDWCPPGRGADEYKAPLVFTDSVVCMDVCRKAEYIFGEIGWSEEQEFASKLFVKLRAAIRERLIDREKMLAVGNCQTSQAMGMFYKVFEPCEMEAAGAELLRIIKENGDFIDAGILGARVIFHVLSGMGQSDLAYKMITRPEYPSYGDWVARGATTLWENFHPEDSGIWSRNHHFFGDISNWFIQCIAGIKYNLNFDGRTCIAPEFIEKLDFAEAFHIAPQGRIYVKWTRNSQGIELEISVPGGLCGEIKLPPGWAFADGEITKPLCTGKFSVGYHVITN